MVQVWLGSSLALIGIIDPAAVFELADLADTMQYRPAKEQVRIHTTVVPRNSAHQEGDRQGVFQKSADIGMVHFFGRRGPFEALHEIRIAPEQVQQRF